MEHRISVVIATRNRRDSLGPTLDRLLALPESPEILLVDNGSTDGTVDFVRAKFPSVRAIGLAENLGAAARNVGVREAGTPYVAFSDDDSWWEPGSLARASDRLDAHPRVALVAARVLVGPGQDLDPTCLAMAASPLPGGEGLPGPVVLGFLACGAIVRRASFLEAGGFEARYGVGGEEELLALDLASAGWSSVYCDDVVAHHRPGVSGARPGRRRRQYRNELWTAWLRRPPASALRCTARVASRAISDPAALPAVVDALGGFPWVLRGRRPIPRGVEESLRLLGR